MDNTDTSVRLERGAVHINDRDPQDVVMVRNARSVLEHSAEMLGSAGCTLREARFAANELARSLRDMLDLVDPQEGNDE